MRRSLIAAVLGLVGSMGGAANVSADDDLAARARDVLAQRCAKCHGKVNPQSGLNVLDHAYLLDGYVAAGKLDESDLWDRISTDDRDVVMPPAGAIPADEQNVLRQWILGGARAFPAAPVNARPFLSEEDVFTAIERDLRRMPAEDRGDVRYFGITHLHNNPTVSDRDLRSFRAALSKLANSLSWERRIVLPVAIDEHETILRVNLVDLGWDRDKLWHRILTHYPYGLSHDSSRNARLQSAATYVYEATGSRIPIVRADWFVGTASVPPLYHEMLRIPEGPGADRALERQLGVDVARDFDKNRLVRAGFVKSNVSQHNRLVDRHAATHGAYWKSYDFKSSAGRQNLLDFPLGPALDDHPFPRQAFEHDGGEIIFNLPNGLQGYMLIDAQGKRIDRGPIEVVFDSKKPLGNSEVINGISCMVCHARGMQRFTDDMRAGHSVVGAPRVKVERLVPEQRELDRWLDEDERRFLAAAKLATGSFLLIEEDARTPFEKLPEPVGAIAGQYAGELRFADVVAELGHPEPDTLRPLFRDQSYRRFGVSVLADGKVLKRETWERMNPYSNFHEVSDRLGLGTPERVFPD